jgi:hypothetical protein
VKRKQQRIIATKVKTLGETMELTATVRKPMWKDISDEHQEIRKQLHL